ncbi:type IV pilus modification PilV family protein [Iodidimonas gelatinilytica]
MAASRIAKRAGADRSGGFTILEVLVALAILGTALAALFGLQQSASRAAIAVERAQQSMERIAPPWPFWPASIPCCSPKDVPILAIMPA